MKILSIVGARPQFIKLAPLNKVLRCCKPDIKHVIVHTGQHYDYNMSKLFFDELGISEPDYHLSVGSGTHGEQTGKMLETIEQVLVKEDPDMMVVYGDTNSTLAGALSGVKLQIPVAHVESGMRSYNKTMPEEINRILADHCSNILFCPTENAVENLKKEGFTDIYVHGDILNRRADSALDFCRAQLVVNVGDIMYESFLMCLEIAGKKSGILTKLKLAPKEYFLATVHRAENTNDKSRLKSIVQALTEIGREKPVVFPIHPRTRKYLESDSCFFLSPEAIRFIDPVSYYDMLRLESGARMILTDSGGIQKEAYFLKVPCVTLRDETEWIETVGDGWNVIAGANKENIIDSAKCFSSRDVQKNVFGDGRTSEKIVEVIKSIYEKR